MKLCRSLAMAAAVAVATPLTLFAATPALAAGTPAAQAQKQPTHAELVKAAADTKTAYEKAVGAEKEGKETLEATLAALESDTHPLRAAVTAANRTAKEAAGTKATAEKAVTDAEAALEAAASDTEKAEAQKALDTAKADLAKAAEAQRKADAAAAAAQTALDDARVAAVRAYSVLQQDVDNALKAKQAAEEALAAAEECVRADGLTSLAVGLPAEVVAGSTVDFTLRVTNGTEHTLSVKPLVFFHADGESADGKSPLAVEWSNGSGWQTLSGAEPEHIATVDALAPGAHSDVKLRMKVDDRAKAADAFALFAGDASSAYNPCVLGPMKRYDFTVLPAGSESDPEKEAEPVAPGKGDDKRPAATKPGAKPAAKPGAGTTTQGGASRQTVTTTGGTPAGSLAATGTSPAMTPIAVTGALAVALGAGTVFVVRRRRATDHS
ncbi:hypothetical protein ABZ023_13185 [Streptomyces sp. NPDC006367]|uniref:hypothetical protein n=1 Tax=unclassified Streptomyces TaxID=2593676 RepID=UPI0033B32AE0